MIDKKILTSLVSAFGASLCCITPVVAVLAGSTGMASTFSWIEPARDYLVVLTILILIYAWWDKLKPKKDDIECACDPDENGKISFWHTKTFLAIVTIFSALMLSFPYWGDSLIKSDKPKVVYVDKSQLKKISINIEGMTCKACEATVEKVANDVDGVTYIKASVDNKNAVVEFDQSKTDSKSIMKAIGTTGYKPVSYVDKDGSHKVEGIKLDKHKDMKKQTSSKCGGGKCGAGRCGAGKCGTKKE